MLVLNRSIEELRAHLLYKSLFQQYNISDPFLADALEYSFRDEMMGIYDIELYTQLVFHFPMRIINVPFSLIDYQEQYYYNIVFAFQVPGLLKYVSQPAFREFVSKIEFTINTGYGSLLEFVYLPTSNIILNESEEDVLFASTPASFMLGIQNQGNIAPEDYFNFLSSLRKANNYIMKLIN